MPFHIPDGDDPVSKLKRFKMLNGLSYRRLSELTGIDESQLAEWIKGVHRPSMRSVLKINKFLS